jgi:hypothetical protein
MLARGPWERQGATGRRPERRPLVARALAVWLGAAPLLQALSLAGLRVASFAPDRPWNYVAYGLVAPYVAWLVWRRHPRARFAAYVFFTHEAVRGAHFDRWDAVALAGLWILLLQLPAARRWLPSLRPAEMRARWRGRPGFGGARPRGGAPRDPAAHAGSQSAAPRGGDPR